jgi:ubiquinone/menaquinone biosynthesis C-methylase UbiE
MTHLDSIRKAFTAQAGKFGQQGLTLSDPGYLQWSVAALPLDGAMSVLDVASGTGHLGRALAPHVRHVTALDATSAMLLENEKATKEAGLTNITYQVGVAEALPFRSGTFDLVACRLAVHHYADPEPAVDEMARVCRPGGYVALVDMVAPEDGSLAESYNRLERLRDPSHTRACTQRELEQLLSIRGMALHTSLARDISVHVDPWLALTAVDDATRTTICRELEAEVAGERPSGMRSFVQDGELYFTQTWVVIAATMPR